MFDGKVWRHQKNKTDVKDFLAKSTAFVKENVGVVMGLCLFALFLFLLMVFVAAIIHPTLVLSLFDSSAFVLVRVVVIVVAIYTGVSAFDYAINFLMLKMPTELMQNFRNDFMLRMNYMSMKANTNMISALLIRFFNIAAFSPTIINSPTMNFVIAFISMFGVVIVLMIKHIFLWLFNLFIKPIMHLLWKDKLEPKKEAMTGKIKSEYHKVEKPFKEKLDSKKAEHKTKK